MDNMSTDKTKNDSQKDSVLKEVFDRYADDIITDKQIERLLKPIIQMIKEGRFDRKITKLWEPILALAAVLILAITVLFTQIDERFNRKVLLEEPRTPTTSFTLLENTISGRIHIEDKGVEGIMVQLLDSNSQLVDLTMTNEMGEYTLKNFKNGIYMLKVILPEDMMLENGEHKGFIQVNGKNEISFNDNNRNISEINLRIYMRN